MWTCNRNESWVRIGRERTVKRERGIWRERDENSYRRIGIRKILYKKERFQ